MYDRVDPGVPVPGVCGLVSTIFDVSLWRLRLAGVRVDYRIYLSRVTSPHAARAGRADARHRLPAGQRAGVRFAVRTVGAVASGSRLRTRGGGARPPTAERAPAGGDKAGRPRGRRARAADAVAGAGRAIVRSRHGAHRLRLARAIAPERETRDIVGSSTKYAVRRFDNRHVQTNRHRGST